MVVGNAQEKNRLKLMQAGLAIEDKTAKQAKSLGFFPSRLILTHLPIREPYKNQYTITNGRQVLEINGSSYGVPYGVYARIDLVRMVTLAVKTQSPHLELKPISQHLKEFGIAPTGGSRGTISLYRNQMLRLLTMSVNCSMENKDGVKGRNFHLIKEYELWSNKTTGASKTSDAMPHITLSDYFYNEIVGSDGNRGTAVPFAMRAIKALKHSPLQMDLYLFLTYRFNAIRNDKHIPWVSLKNQFGENYADTPEALRNFKKQLISALKRVLVVYPDANIGMDEGGLWLKRSKQHV